MNDLYELNEKDISELSIRLADNYFYDDLYVYVFDDEMRRFDILEKYFRQYIKTIRKNYHFLADSEKKESFIILYDSRKSNKAKDVIKVGKVTTSLFKILKELKTYDNIKRAAKYYNLFSWTWVNDFVNKDYFHIDIMFTKRAYRNQGHTKKVMEKITKYANEQNMDITLETHNKDNVSFFENFGFVLLKTITQGDISMYCMLKKAEE